MPSRQQTNPKWEQCNLKAHTASHSDSACETRVYCNGSHQSLLRGSCETYAIHGLLGHAIKIVTATARELSRTGASRPTRLNVYCSMFSQVWSMVLCPFSHDIKRSIVSSSNYTHTRGITLGLTFHFHIERISPTEQICSTEWHVPPYIIRQWGTTEPQILWLDRPV